MTMTMDFFDVNYADMISTTQLVNKIKCCAATKRRTWPLL